MIKKKSISRIGLDEIGQKILNYINSKGLMQATILTKLENYLFDHLSLRSKLEEDDLLRILVKLILDEEIHILIPFPFKTIWFEEQRDDFSYLKKGKYLLRKFEYISDFSFNEEINKYLFDSRKNLSEEPEEIFFQLKELINSHLIIPYFIIIQLKKSKIPINIYHNLEKTDLLIDENIKIPDSDNKKERKIEIPLDIQKKNINIVKNFRSRYMCFYITLIDSIHYYLTYLQRCNSKKNSNTQKIRNMELKYAYYCNQFTRSDWIDIKKGNPYRWESFFRHFKLPIKLQKVRINGIKFHGRSFESNVNIKFFIKINRDKVELINNLKKKGYKLFENNVDNKISIGLELDVYSICPSIEYYFFLFKYVIYYYLFQLFHYTCEYLMSENKELKFKESEKEIYKLFSPCLQQLFLLKKGRVQDQLNFKFITYNKDELEVIYNRFLMSEVFKIEKKLFRYFLLRNLKK